MAHINSASYISVLCSEDANPKFNRLQLRTDPPTFIELHPDWNILRVEDFPDLKYGFSQIDEILDENEAARLEGIMSTYEEENCQDVLEFDFSHFDASEMTTMDKMFDWMRNIRKIEFGTMCTPKLISAERAFMFANSKSPIDVLDLSGLDFSSLALADFMFSFANIGVLNLSGCNLSNIKDWAANLFENAGIRELNLDNTLLTEEALESLKFILTYSDSLKLSLKGWKESDIRKVIQELENYFSTFTNPEMKKPEYVLDRGLDFKLNEMEDGKLDCQLLKVHRVSSKRFKISGTVLERYIDNRSIFVAIPDGICHIEDNAFEDCDGLEMVILPESVRSIGKHAFCGCTSLRLINIPSSVKEIGYGVFAGCTHIKHLYLPDNVEKCESLNIEKLNYLRLPIHLWTGGLCASMQVSHIVVGINGMELPANIDSNILGEKRRGTITFEVSLNTSIKSDGLCSIDGALLMCKNFKEEEKQQREITALTIANSTLAVPTGVVYLADGCFGNKRTFPIYIPETVKHISPKSIQTKDGIRPILVTKKSNYHHLKSILPQGVDCVIIYLI